MRRRIFEIIEVADDNDYISHAYDIFMIVVIILSIIPLGMKNVSILPYFILINSGFGLLRLLRLARALRVVRIFKIFRYSTNMEISSRARL